MSRQEAALNLLAGALLLLVVHTLGRFIFTPLLPYLVEDGLITLAQGASLASVNYFGYLIGALMAMRWHRVDDIQRFLMPTLILHLITTLLQTQVTDFTQLNLLRWINGVTNGLVFVQAPALLLEWLVLQRRGAQSGLVYLGVGVGLLVSSLLVSATAAWLFGAARWWPAAVVSVPLAFWGGLRLSRLKFPEKAPATASPVITGKLVDSASFPLFMAYAGAGLGYILPMTFLPALAKSNLPLQPQWVSGAWFLVAVATIPSAWFWNRAGARWGDKRVLQVNLLIQLAGASAAVLFSGRTGIILCALLVGGTFLGTVLMTQRHARLLHPHQGGRLSGALIALYGMAQWSGPWLTQHWLGDGGDLRSAFWLGVAALAWAFLWMLLVPARPAVQADGSR